MQVIITLEIILGLEQTSPSQLSQHGVSGSHPQTPSTFSQLSKNVLIFVERVTFTCFAVGVSIFFPEFSSMMAFLGSFSAFMLCVIGPVSAKMSLAKKRSIWDIVLLVIAVVMATWGTMSAFLV